MRIAPEVKQRQSELSGVAARFLDFVEEHPACLAAETFRPLHQRPELRKYRAQPWPVFVSRRLTASMAQASIAVTRLVKSLWERVLEKDVTSLMEFYGLEDELTAALMVSEPNGIAGAVARCDLIYGADGPKVLEVNCGSYVGGWQCCVLARHLRQIPALSRFGELAGVELEPTDSAGNLFSHLAADTAAALELAEGPLNLCILVPPEGSHGINAHPLDEYRPRYAAALSRCGAGRGGQVIAGSTAELSFSGSLAYRDGVQVHAALEQNLELTSPALVRSFKARRLNLFTGPASRILNDKRNLALLSELLDSGLFTPAERDEIERYVPWSRGLGERETVYAGQQIELAEFVRDNQHVLVLKEALAWGGDKVHVGRACDRSEWRRLVASCLAEGTWIVQEFVDASPWCFQHDAAGCCPHSLVWGIYVYGQNYGGCLPRLAPSSHGEVVNITQGAQVGFAIEVDEP
jgi:hypothetical protein